MAVFNIEQHLEKCIESLSVQTYSDIEILLVDDGSSDGSASICDKWALRDTRIKCIHQKNQGVSVARNVGMESAKGEWIVFVDGDDHVAPNMIEIMTQAANKEHNLELIMISYFIDKKGQIYDAHFIKGSRSLDFSHRADLIKMAVGIENTLGCFGITNIGVPWGKMYKRDFLQKYNIKFEIDLKRMQDMVFNINVFRVINYAEYIDSPLYYYNIRDDSAVHKYTNDFADIAERILASLRQLLDNCDCFNDEERCQILKYKKIILLLEIIKLCFIHKNSPLPIKQKIREIKNLCHSNIYKESINSKGCNFLNKKLKIFRWMLKKRLYLSTYFVLWLRYRKR